MAERRVLGLDVGERRIGVALSDALGMLASPLTTIIATHRERAIAEIIRLVREHTVIEVVVGLPLTLRGEIGPQAELIGTFARELEAALGFSVALFDERLTTAAAEQMLRELGVKPEKRKQQIDQVAASIILQDYLDHMRNQQMA
ncbi:MAG: Holliday junction resolvase RuvX [Oscillochloris sp.]|nr:Holliday junction resolvase RuvX [Oscillochloris sp.]